MKKNNTIKLHFDPIKHVAKRMHAIRGVKRTARLAQTEERQFIFRNTSP